MKQPNLFREIFKIFILGRFAGRLDPAKMGRIVLEALKIVLIFVLSVARLRNLN